jgi:hypothetical protein
MKLKRLLLALAIAVLWGVSGYFTHGYLLGDFTHQFPDQEQEPFCTVFAYTGGPFGYVIEYIEDGHRHYLQHELTTEQRWQEFQKRYPDLGREYFDREDN